ncbi:MAG: TlpA disulfide reductase family protein [Chloroherpetonaceae bacterium]|nr:TlpA disulfide reductase family protein [Chloroherpetonaceae bacterium]
MKKITSWILPLGIAVILGLLVSKLILGSMSSPSPESGSFGEAPRFHLVGVNGESIDLDALKGKGVIVNFWATWCGPCKAEIPAMIELQKKYQNDFTFIGLAVNDTEEKVNYYIQQDGINYPIAMDNGIGQNYSRLLKGGMRGIPTSFVINKTGKIIEVRIGTATKDELETMIQQSISN